MKLNEVYQSLLRYAGLEADNQGYISTVIDNGREPALINGQRLVLPTTEQLRMGNSKEKVFFHPLAENILRGESEVLMKYVEVVNVRLNFTFGIIGQTLLSIAASAGEHGKLTPDQSDMVISIKDVDDLTVKNFTTMMVECMRNDATRAFLHIFLKRGGTIGAKRYSRVGVVSFNVYEELCKGASEIHGVKLRVKDREAFKALYEYIFPNVADPASYNRGSDSEVSPYFDAFMKTSMVLAARFNDINESFRDFMDEPDKIAFDSDWVDTFSDLTVLIPEIRRVPVQPGNEGQTPYDQQAAQQAPRPTLPVPVHQPQPVQQPMQHMPNVGYPAPYQQQQQPYQQQRPEIRETSRGIDFNSLKQVTPALAYQPNPMGSQWPRPGMPMQQERTPGWAAPGQGPMGGYPPGSVPFGYQGQPTGNFGPAMGNYQMPQQQGWGNQPMGMQPRGLNTNV